MKSDEGEGTAVTELPPLTRRQRDLLWALASSIQKNGYPPSIRELGTAAGLHSTATVYNHLHQLERKRYIRRFAHSPRAIEVLYLPPAFEGNVTTAEGDSLNKGRVSWPAVGEPTLDVHILGRIKAGLPVLAQEEAGRGSVGIPETRAGATFALRVEGDSMIGADIRDGDYVLVRAQETADSGDIVVALLGEEATVKRLRRTADGPMLVPENPDYAPLSAREAQILGRVEGIYRPV